MRPILSTVLLIIGTLILTISSQAQQRINTGGFVQYPESVVIANDSMVVVSDWIAFEIVPAMMESAILKYSLTNKTKDMANQTAPTLQNKELKVSITVNASTAQVWQALTDPAIIEQYFFGSKAQSTWKEGSPVTFTGEWKGKTYQDKGTILKAVPNKILQHTYWSSMGQLDDAPENYIIVTYRLEGDDQHTELTVTQDKSTNEEESKGLWKTVLENLKKTVERK